MIQCYKFEIINFYQEKEMEELIANCVRNCARNFDEMLHNSEGDEKYHAPVGGDDE